MLQPDNIDDGFDRSYIEDYMGKTKNYFRGDVLEFDGKVSYLNSGNANIYKASYIYDRDKYSNSDYYIDLRDETTLPDKKFDCIVATQVICYVVNVFLVLCNLKKMLKPGGVLVLTNSGPIYQDITGDGYKVFYTKEGLLDLCGTVFGKDNLSDLVVYGDFNHAVYFLLGVKREKSSKRNINNSENLSVLIGLSCHNR